VAPVVLAVSADGRARGMVMANAFRADLRSAGLGEGCHAFSVPYPAGAKHVAVCRASDGAVLARAARMRAA